ncbi:MAG: alpha/beta hydrolase [Akkermansiaceae bacterium]|jgi:acetyl esterase/lipase|nr:alpha/beta hydrolase [Akkermansiaceae bacterium]MDP4645789.1 alpha/beta hydrolase [Akkermansiaceae bacterium]MDP4720092.1 alpha/beta hydrolase [Akkermansiaceae bacterium]MDP4779038.1 alpha/beta hydrolase [Akkermansiaceae bacterium]MDP4847958.1 alpha/beta hydrolase [Akkermansiaceae bacterium]
MKFILILLAVTTHLHADWQNLWTGDAPGAPRPPAGTEITTDRGHKGYIEVPQYWLHTPAAEKSNGAAVVIFPGGGYSVLAMEHEGHAYAKWLNERGFTAIVVKYRVGAGLGYQYPVPFLDARRAIRTLRHRADELGIKPDCIGVMGSSAGGHLASLCATRFSDKLDAETTDEIDSVSARPDFAILCYPVINMDSKIAHGGSRNNLTGKNAPPELLEKLSTEKAVTKDTPPTFLLTTSDDSVNCRNSLFFAAACKEHKVPVTLHMFEKGGHGYGLEGKGALAGWPDLLEEWLAERYPGS